MITKDRLCCRSPWAMLLAGSFIVLAGWAVYSNSFHGPFIFDDEKTILDNSTIRHLRPIGAVFSPPRSGETVSGRPILNLSFALNYALSGKEVWGYHITNLVIHLFNGLILLGILRQTFLLPLLRPNLGRNSLPLAAAIALLWVVHPLQTESVTYIVQRAESLAAMFYLLVLYAVIRGSQSGRSTTGWYLAAVVACWLGMATKETVATAPVMVLLYDRTLLAGTFRQAWQRRWGLYLGLAASWALLVGLIYQRGFVTKTVGPCAPGVWGYASSQPGVILYYLRLALWPHPLCLDWNWPVAETWLAIYGLMLVVGLLLAATIWGLLRDSHRAWGLLGAWFFLILVPSSTIVPLTQLACEHRMYLPLAAVMTLLVIGVYRVSQRWIMRGGLAVGLCLVMLVTGVLGLLTFQRNRDYQSAGALWEDVIKKVAADYPGPYNNWGIALLKAGRLLEAKERFEKALQLNPNLVEANYNLGNVLWELGRPAEALPYYEQTLRLDPKNAEALHNLGRILLLVGQPAEAIKYFEQAVQLKPDYAAAYSLWGNALLALGQPADAIPHYKQALRIDPDYAEAHSNWGAALFQLGRWTEAIEQYQQFLRIAPDSPDSASVHLNLASALSRAGRLDEAIATAQKALQRAKAAGQNSLAEEIFKRLQLYREQKTYREK